MVHALSLANPQNFTGMEPVPLQRAPAEADEVQREAAAALL